MATLQPREAVVSPATTSPASGSPRRLGRCHFYLRDSVAVGPRQKRKHPAFDGPRMGDSQAAHEQLLRLVLRDTRGQGERKGAQQPSSCLPTQQLIAGRRLIM